MVALYIYFITWNWITSRYNYFKMIVNFFITTENKDFTYLILMLRLLFFYLQYLDHQSNKYCLLKKIFDESNAFFCCICALLIIPAQRSDEISVDLVATLFRYHR